MASGAGYSVLLCSSDEDRAQESRYLQVSEQERVTGVIIAARAVDCDLSRHAAARVPLVAIDRTATAPVDYVLAHSHRGAAMVVHHLLDGGWQRRGASPARSAPRPPSSAVSGTPTWSARTAP